jgi:hypothetical protein
MLAHAPDPTKAPTNWSSVARAYFEATTLCMRKPRAHGQKVVTKHTNVECTRCLKKLGMAR